MATITREPEHPGYDTLGDAHNWGEDYYLLIDGTRIGGTYWCPVGHNIEAGKQWASYGPAGLQMGFPTREDAEQAQLEASDVTPAPVDTITAPTAPKPETKPLRMTWEQALAEAKEHGVARCSDSAAMAQFCDANIHRLVGAVSPQLVWESAMKNGMTLLALGRLAGKDPLAVDELQWI
jgi:hypothetical protein